MNSVELPADELIDEFVARSQHLNGKEVVERPPWNTCATDDAIRHFAYGTSDSNPLWLDAEYAGGTLHGGLLAPPAFLCSVLYPFLHGEPMDVHLSSLIGKVQMEWTRHIREGDRLRASARQLDVTESLDRRGRRLVYVDAETTYWNQRDEVVCKAIGTMVRIARREGDLLVDREIYRYNEAERASIRDAIGIETRAGARGRFGAEVWVGQCLPVFVRGPLTVGDLVCWQAAIGPSYRAGTLGYQDILRAPHNAAINPVTGWPVKYSQQHEDFLMASQRGMPAPFDNSLMRFAWIAPMLTDWIGDAGFLKRLSIQTGGPILYGDTTWYRGIVTHKYPAPEGEGVGVTIKISGVNQIGQLTTSGEAEVIIPARRPSGPGHRRSRHDGEPRTPEPGVLDLLCAQVVARPDDVAVQGGNERLTFAELNTRTDRLARLLTRHGAATNVPVVLVLERNPSAVVAILSALKAGCAYVPLDSNLPAERQELVLSCISPRIVLGPAACLASFRERHLPAVGAGEMGCDLLDLETIAREEGDGDDFESLASPAGEDLAYIMPTSGTLGAPRFVAVSHRSLGRYLRSLSEPLGITARDVYLHTATFSFSSSVRQMLLPLSLGARLVMANDEERLDPMALFDLMRKRAVTVWDTVPSIWWSCMEALAIVSEADRARVLDNSLRLVLTTGEALPWRTPYVFRNGLGHKARVVNLYSQTETAGTVCVFQVSEQIADREGFVPLGEPVASTTVHLLDANLRPVPPEEVGEVCVSGGRLASGYFGQGELTSERFPLRAFQHEGFYRTGDLARRRGNGVLEFVGRSDSRVKIRGQRVELGEVEEALRKLPGVEDAIVVLHEDENGATRLVAYPAGRTAEFLAPREILARLRSVLPAAALPDVFIPLERLPRNPAGKVDRSALPAPARCDSSTTAEASGHSLESAVERIFADALELRGVAHDESFFDMGGNSLMATRVITRLRATFCPSLPMKRFFEKPTVAAVTAVMEEYLLREIEALTEEEASRLLAEESVE